MLNHGNLYQAKFNSFQFGNKPLDEYPRPNLVRSGWINLNGLWDFAISKEKRIPDSFTRKIMVPFAPESPLSLVHQLIEPDDYLIYRKQVTLPKSYIGKNILLHFEGIDQTADIYINDKLIKSHAGIAAFTVHFPYEERITITVVANDKTDLAFYARGKQALKPNKFMYTSSSGIIKPVWLEAVDEVYIHQIKFYPNYDDQSVDVLVKANTDETVKLLISHYSFDVTPNQICNIKLPFFHAWSNLDPYLYEVRAMVANDKIESYFGVRKIEIKEINGKPRIISNDKPIFMSGVLYQGYFFLGNMTPATYGDYFNDIKRLKDLGFNTIRVHAKIECERFYYYCDQIGMFVIQDFPSGGGKYHKSATLSPKYFTNRDYQSLDLKKTGRDKIESQEIFLEEVDYYLNHFNNYPSILIYTIFNEAWGEFKPDEIYKRCKEKDHLHLFDTASGWLDAPSDFFSVHTFSFPRLKRNNRNHRAFIISEMGGLGLKLYNHAYFDGFFGHKASDLPRQFKDKYCYLYRRQMKSQIDKRGLNMCIYTQFNDCECEYDGLYTFDRLVLKIDPKIVMKLNLELYGEINKATTTKK